MPVNELSHRSGARSSLERLARRALAADEGAFEGLHARLGGGLKSFFQRRVGGNGELIEELAQRTWVEAWRTLASRRYDPSRSAFSTFLYAVGYKVYLRYLKSERGRGSGRRVFGERGLDGLVMDALGESEDLDAALDLAALLDALRACIGALEARAVAEVELVVLAGVLRGDSERALASALGLAPSTVNARKHAVLEKLRLCLAEKGFREPIERRRE